MESYMSYWLSLGFAETSLHKTKRKTWETIKKGLLDQREWFFSQLSLFTDFTMTRLKFLLYATHMKVYERCENSSWVLTSGSCIYIDYE